MYIICKVLRPEDQYHAGIVVADLDAALEKLTALAGYQFADEYKGENLVRTPDGESLVSMPICRMLIWNCSCRCPCGVNIQTAPAVQAKARCTRWRYSLK